MAKAIVIYIVDTKSISKILVLVRGKKARYTNNNLYLYSLEVSRFRYYIYTILL